MTVCWKVVDIIASSFVAWQQGALSWTMSFSQALPPFGVLEWRVVTLLLLDALGAQILPAVGSQLAANGDLHFQVSLTVDLEMYTPCVGYLTFWWNVHCDSKVFFLLETW